MIGRICIELEDADNSRYTNIYKRPRCGGFSRLSAYVIIRPHA